MEKREREPHHRAFFPEGNGQAAAAGITDALLGVPLVPLKGYFPRRVPIGRLFGLCGPLSPGDTAVIRIPEFLRPSVKAGRFNVPGIKALYASEDEGTAEGEVYQHPGLAGIVSERPPDAVYQIDVQLQAVLDLTAPGIPAGFGSRCDPGLVRARDTGWTRGAD